MPYKPDAKNGSEESKPPRTLTTDPTPNDQTPRRDELYDDECENNVERRVAASIQRHVARGNGTTDCHDRVRCDDRAAKHDGPSLRS